MTFSITIKKKLKNMQPQLSLEGRTSPWGRLESVSLCIYPKNTNTNLFHQRNKSRLHQVVLRLPAVHCDSFESHMSREQVCPALLQGLLTLAALGAADGGLGWAGVGVGGLGRQGFPSSGGFHIPSFIGLWRSRRRIFYLFSIFFVRFGITVRTRTPMSTRFDLFTLQNKFPVRFITTSIKAV